MPFFIEPVPENSTYKEVILSNRDQIEIQGIVVHIMKDTGPWLLGRPLLGSVPGYMSLATASINPGIKIMLVQS
jgi:hypothetical protein